MAGTSFESTKKSLGKRVEINTIDRETVHVVAGAVKRYLRGKQRQLHVRDNINHVYSQRVSSTFLFFPVLPAELPEPLFTYCFYDTFIAAMRM